MYFFNLVKRYEGLSNHSDFILNHNFEKIIILEMIEILNNKYLN